MLQLEVHPGRERLHVPTRHLRTVVAPHLGLAALEREGDLRLRVEVGVVCARLAKQCVRWGLGPAAFFIGIPGTVGGALAMNAGAFGGETWRLVRTVETVDRSGDLRHRDATEYAVGYRSVTPPAPGEWFVAAHLEFPEGGTTSDEEITALLLERKEKQPIGLPTCGSVFTNPPGDHAARLIESAGLKGLCIGGAQVSERHANFIVNLGGATAADIEALIGEVRARVRAQLGIDLIPEVRIVGEAA